MKIRLFTIPNMLTLANLLCGSLAIHRVVESGDYIWGFALIIMAAIFDFCDGLSARLLNQISPIGIELDSLADMVSFGVAPAMILSSLIATEQSSIEWLKYVPYAIIAMSALRLAKFNIDTTQHEEFVGLPTPACAIACSSLGLMESYGVTIDSEWLAAIAALLAALLISPIRMFSLKFKDLSLRCNALRYGFIVMALLLFAIKPLFAPLAIVALYIMVSTIRHLYGMIYNKI